MKVILADDSELVLERIKELVNRYKKIDIVGMYKNGIDALNGLKGLKPDLTIIDLNMPGLSGMEVLTEIRKVDTELKYIIFTFYASEIYRTKALKAGADHFFSKVDDVDKLVEVIEEMLSVENKKEKQIVY
ncbi:MAG: response regulator transcription factor [Bacteroidota bacterium]